MTSAYQKSRPAAPDQPAAGEAFIPGLTPGAFSLESDNEHPYRVVYVCIFAPNGRIFVIPRKPRLSNLQTATLASISRGSNLRMSENTRSRPRCRVRDSGDGKGI
jgi:hypothetical protein